MLYQSTPNSLLTCAENKTTRHCYFRRETQSLTLEMEEVKKSLKFKGIFAVVWCSQVQCNRLYNVMFKAVRVFSFSSHVCFHFLP